MRDTHAHTHTGGKAALVEGSTRCRDFYFITHKADNRQISTPRAESELFISASEQQQTHVLYLKDSGVGERLVENTLLYFALK